MVAKAQLGVLAADTFTVPLHTVSLPSGRTKTVAAARTTGVTAALKPTLTSGLWPTTYKN